MGWDRESFIFAFKLTKHQRGSLGQSVSTNFVTTVVTVYIKELAMGLYSNYETFILKPLELHFCVDISYYQEVLLSDSSDTSCDEDDKAPLTEEDHQEMLWLHKHQKIAQHMYGMDKDVSCFLVQY